MKRNAYQHLFAQFNIFWHQVCSSCMHARFPVVRWVGNIIVNILFRFNDQRIRALCRTEWVYRRDSVLAFCHCNHIPQLLELGISPSHNLMKSRINWKHRSTMWICLLYVFFRVRPFFGYNNYTFLTAVWSKRVSFSLQFSTLRRFDLYCDLYFSRNRTVTFYALDHLTSYNNNSPSHFSVSLPYPTYRPYHLRMDWQFVDSEFSAGNNTCESNHAVSNFNMFSIEILHTQSLWCFFSIAHVSHRKTRVIEYMYIKIKYRKQQRGR